MIKLQIVGHLGKDAVVRDVNGKKVIGFTVAHTEKYKDAQGNQREKTYWVDCSYWTDRTTVADYLTKGKLVYTEGTPDAEAYTNKEGQPAASLRLRVSSLQLLGGNNSDGNNSSQGYGNNQYAAAAPAARPQSAPANMPVEDDLPF